MQKALLFLLAALLVLTFMVGCGKKEEPRTEPAVEEPATAPADTTTMMEDTTAVMDTTMQMMDTAGQ